VQKSPGVDDNHRIWKDIVAARRFRYDNADRNVNVFVGMNEKQRIGAGFWGLDRTYEELKQTLPFRSTIPLTCCGKC
jgi:hypothetical protein